MSSFVGLGPMPGTNPVAAADIMLGESVQGRVHLPVLPARGLGADAIGRTGAMLVDIVLDRGPRSWRIVDKPSRTTWRARDFLTRDLDACEEVWGTSARCVRLPAVGPWSLAAAIELAGGQRLLTDRGAVRFIAESLAEGLVQQAADVRRRTGAQVEFLLSEPLLPAVAKGRVAAPSSALGDSGYLPAQGWREMAALLRQVTSALPAGANTVLHLPTVSELNFGLVAESGVSGIGVGLAGLRTTQQLDFVGALIGSGLTLELGAVSPAHITRAEHTGAAEGPDPRAIAERAVTLWAELGFAKNGVVSGLDLAPTEGLSTYPEDVPAAVWASGRKAAELLSRAAGDLGE